MPRSKLTLESGGAKNANPPQPKGPKPGVYEDEIHPPGEHWYKILTPSGAVGTMHLPDELWDRDVVGSLRKLFDRKAQTLKVIP
jgi:hypothetical protein